MEDMKVVRFLISPKKKKVKIEVNKKEKERRPIGEGDFKGYIIEELDSKR